MYVMPVEIKLATIFELWSDLLPDQILHLGGLSKLWYLNWLFACTSVIQLAALLYLVDV